MWTGCALGVILRLALYAAGVSEYLEEHLELNTPITSHVRLKECFFLLDAGISPYPGNTCHHPPLVVQLFLPLHRAASGLAHFGVLVAIDLATALLLRALAAQYAAARTRAGRHYEEAQVRLPKLTGPGREEATPDGPCPVETEPRSGELLTPTFVGLLYLLNPLIVASCVAFSLQGLHHLFTTLALVLAGAGRGGASAVVLALLLYVCPLTPVVLVVPCAFLAYCQRQDLKGPGNNHDGAHLVAYSRSKTDALLDVRFLFYLACFSLAVLALFVCLCGASLAAMGGEPHFLYACFASVLLVRDLTPNVGLFWYLFIEVFDRFRSLFLLAFQGHLFFYSVPLQLRLGRHRPVGPFLHGILAIGIISLFRPYPTLSDHALMLAALMIPSELLHETERNFVFLMGGQLFGLCMFPTMVTVWLGRNAGNANFLYNMTLVINVFGTLLLQAWACAGIRLRRRQRLGLFCREIVLTAVEDMLAKAPALASAGGSNKAASAATLASESTATQGGQGGGSEIRRRR